MTPRWVLFLLLGGDAAILLYEAASLSLTYHGAELIYTDAPGAMTYILRASLALLGPSDLALRLPMIVMNMLSAVLLYVMAKPYIRRERERLWLVAFFLLLPGVISSSLLVDGAALVTLGLFIFIFLRRRYGEIAEIMLPLLLWADPAFLLLPVGLGVHAYKQRRFAMLPLYAVLGVLALWIHGFDTGGLPQSRFLDTLGLYAAIFSPVIFLYLFYTLYRRYIASQTDLLWDISTTALLVSLLLSFRQRVEIEQFAPFFMVALPLGMQTFYHSYRVRLRPFRRRYRILFALALGTLFINAAAVFFNKTAYLFLEHPEHYFAYRAHIAKELAAGLNAHGVTCAQMQNRPRMQLRLRFYGIGECADYRISEQTMPDANNVTIRYYGVPVATFYVTKILKN